MKEYVRIVSFISPSLELQLLKYELSTELIDAFKKMWKLYEQLKNIVLLVLPNEIKGIFQSNNVLRVLLDTAINNTQSNIIFVSTYKKDNCKNISAVDVFSDGDRSEYANRFIINALHDMKYPCLWSLQEERIKKSICLCCHDVDKPCFCEMELICNAPLSDANLFLTELARIASMSTELWCVKRDSLTAHDVKALGFLIAILHGVDLSMHAPVSTDALTDGFVNDLRNIRNIDSLTNISFSVLRAALFPSVSDPTTTRNEFSIDWHRNNPFIKQKIKLYRIDVVAPSKTGIGKTSGIERVLMGVDSSSKKYFLAYTDSHDFSDALITNRVSLLS